MVEERRSNIFAIVVFIVSIIIWRLAIWLSEYLPIEFFRHQQIIFASTVCIASCLLIAVALKVHSKQPTWLGLSNRQSNLNAFLIGILSYLIPTGILLVICILGNIVTIQPIASWQHILSSVILLAVIVFLAEALPEELLFRGYFWAVLSGKSPIWLRITLQMVLFVGFAALIGAVSNLLDASFLATFAIVLGILRQAKLNLFAPIGFHLAFMTTQQAFGSSWDLFHTAQHAFLQTYLFAMIPFSLCIMYFAGRFSWINQST